MWEIVTKSQKVIGDVFLPKYQSLIENTHAKLAAKNITDYYITVSFHDGGWIIEEINAANATTNIPELLAHLKSLIYDYIEFKFKYHGYWYGDTKPSQLVNKIKEVFEPEISEYITITIEPCSKYLYAGKT